MNRYTARISTEIHKLLRLGHYASRSLPGFLRDTFDAENLVLDRALVRFSPLPQLPARYLEKVFSTQVTLPPRQFLQDGTQSVDGLYFLSSLARALDIRQAFEIGTFTGATAWTLAANVPELTIHTLDLPAGGAPELYVERDDRTFIPARRRRHVFEGHPEERRIVFLEGDSAKFDFSTFRTTFDLVYIDGAHSYDYVAKDTESAFQIVNDSGVIVWDDYLPGWEGLVRYLHERTDLELYLVPGTRLVLWLSQAAKLRLVESQALIPR